MEKLFLQFIRKNYIYISGIFLDVRVQHRQFSFWPESRSVNGACMVNTVTGPAEQYHWPSAALHYEYYILNALN